jgi:hypothetical protein
MNLTGYYESRGKRRTKKIARAKRLRLRRAAKRELNKNEGVAGDSYADTYPSGVRPSKTKQPPRERELAAFPQ